LSDLSGRNLQLEEFKDPKPGSWWYLDAIKPAIREIMEGIATALAAVHLASDPVRFIAMTGAAKNMALFPAKSTEVEPGPIF